MTNNQFSMLNAQFPINRSHFATLFPLLPLAVRFIEEIDFDYIALDATAILLTAAS